MWQNLPFKTIKKGETFRLFEPGGKRVVGEDGDEEFVAVADAYKSGRVWVVNVKKGANNGK